jgi:thioredoxin
MKLYILNLFTAFVILLISCSNGQNNNNTLPAIAFSDKIKSLPDAAVIDVRTPEEYQKGYLPNAINIDWNGGDFETKINAYDKSKPVFVYCLSGARSGKAAEKMRDMGFKEVYALKGGILKWRAANLPETTNSAITTTGMNKAQFDELLKTDKMVLVDFYADWCAPCLKMKPYLEEIANENKDQLQVIRINADDNKELLNILNIDALPVLMLYKSNSLKWSNVGFISKEEVLKQVK